MSKKIADEIAEQMDAAAVPFFAHLLSSQEPAAEGGTSPTTHCLDSPCTKKYPSDGDEPTSTTWDR